jgi:tetratricopeptide (TPR) repeat protein
LGRFLLDLFFMRIITLIVLATSATLFTLSAYPAPLKLPESVGSSYSSALLDRIPEGRARQVLIEAGQAFQSNNLVKSQALFTELVILAPRSAAAHIGLGELAIMKNDPKNASANFARAMLVDKTDPNAYIGASKASKALKNYAQAEKQIRSAIQLSPNEPRFHLQLGDVLLVGLKNPKKAAIAYERSIALSPQQAAAAFALATAYQQLGKKDDALKQLNVSATLEPKNPLPQWGLGRWYLAAAQPQQALLAFDQALALKPDYVPALLEKSEALFQLDKSDAALETIRSAMALNPQDANVALQYAVALQRAKRFPESEATLRKLLILAPQSAPVLTRLSWLLSSELKRPDEALPLAQQAVKISPKDVSANLSLARALRLTGKLRAAQLQANVALKNMPAPSQDVFLELALVSKDLRDLASAKNWAGKALALDPNNQTAKQLVNDLK